MVKNILSKEFLKERSISDFIIIDVRTPEEFSEFRIRNSVNIPLQSLFSNLDRIDQDKNVLLVCLSGSRSHLGVTLLDQKFKNVFNLSDGLIGWNESNLDLER